MSLKQRITRLEARLDKAPARGPRMILSVWGLVTEEDFINTVRETQENAYRSLMRDREALK